MLVDPGGCTTQLAEALPSRKDSHSETVQMKVEDGVVLDLGFVSCFLFGFNRCINLVFGPIVCPVFILSNIPISTFVQDYRQLSHSFLVE
jgi:hypothetical protein